MAFHKSWSICMESSYHKNRYKQAEASVNSRKSPWQTACVAFPAPHFLTTSSPAKLFCPPPTGFSKQLWKPGGMTYVLVVKITANQRVFFQLGIQNRSAFLQLLVRKILISAKCGDRPTLLLSRSFIRVKLIWI